MTALNHSTHKPPAKVKKFAEPINVNKPGARVPKNDRNPWIISINPPIKTFQYPANLHLSFEDVGVGDVALFVVVVVVVDSDMSLNTFYHLISLTLDIFLV